MAAPSNLNCINQKIKKAVRIMSFKNRDHHTDALFKELEILPLEKSIELKNAKFMWRLHNNYLPDSLSKNFRGSERTNYTTSISRLESLKRFVLFSGPKLWNELPRSITMKPSLNSFSNTLKRYFTFGVIDNVNTRTNNRNHASNHISRLDNNTGLNRPFISRWNQTTNNPSS